MGLWCWAQAFSSSREWVLLFFVVCRFLLLQSMGPRVHGLQKLQLTGSRAWAQQLCCIGLVALKPVGSSWSRDWTHVPCFGRQILNHWNTSKCFILVLYLCKSFRFPWWLSGEEPVCQCRRHWVFPRSGRCCGGGNGNLLQCSCRGNTTDRGSWWATMHGVTKMWTWLQQLSMEQEL